MSSIEPGEEPSVGEPKPDVSDQHTTSRKSYRRKYRKIMVTFEEKMRESNSLFKEEQRITDIAQRLAEQTDQLLELLLELNACPQVPPRLRYDLNSMGANKGDASPFISEEDANLELHMARARLQAGEINIAEYREVEATILRSPGFAPKHSYASLISLVPPVHRSVDKADPSNVGSSGVLTVKQEEQYLQGLDAFLEGAAPNPRPHAMSSLGSRNAEKNAERERETQLKNPVSVYNWLRKHQPQVFLQDNETGADRTPRAAGSRISARKSAQKELIKQEKDYDDEGFAAETAPSRGKRKRDEDGGYRPKGGAPRSIKRKKEGKDEAARSKRTKKPSIDAR
ncbi:hypothetical protein G647_01916 [Cladophialophora carrionii CBS 160.54]|uniref:IEC3 subunit of the Ino80 complex, chromatin re-modelling-domain-containing protein n=1 Tax=Cladophialophora carrionii CBS 160.54 TaxID=1279043 RepID=V9DT15_9EURO|nr:uncharacterized protein G647_01916 [Cladophialophora carrionii CBS 160.54]ETI29463.1 hypothetical protein G647_01916 [Cladophialophora carrionii CBS 160.54]